MRRNAFALGAIAAAVFLAYSNSLRNGFVWDDRVLIQNNPFVQDPANLLHFLNPRFYLGSHAVLSGNRPLLVASLLGDYSLWGLNPVGYHLTNMLLHAVNSAWVYGLTNLLFPAGGAALFAGLLFALHPASSEAVNAISFRSDLLAAFFILPSLWVFIKSRFQRGTKLACFAAGSAGLYGLGLLSKEMAVTLPLLALITELYFPEPGERSRRLGFALAAYALVTLAYLGFWTPRFRYAQLPENSAWRSALNQTAAQLPTAPGPGSLSITPPSPNRVFPASPPPWISLYQDNQVWFWTTAKIFTGYFRLMLNPIVLAADRAPELALGLGSPGAALSAAAVALLAWSSWLMRRRAPSAGFGLAWFLIALIPVAGIFPLYNPVAERYLYLPGAGFAWLTASGLVFLRQRGHNTLAATLAAVLLSAYAMRTYARNWDWASDTALFLDSAPKVALNPRVFYTRAGILRAQGRGEEAALELEKALRLHPGYTEAWMRLAMTYGESGQTARALPCLDKALALDARNPVLRFGAGLFLSRFSTPEKAASMYRAALDLDPGYLEAWVNLAAIYREQGKRRLAEPCYEKAISLAGKDPLPFYSYALLLEQSNDIRRAETLYREALSRDPGYEPARARLEQLQTRAKKRRKLKP